MAGPFPRADGPTSELVERAARLAQEHFCTAEFNCAESSLWGIALALGLPLCETVLRVATPFGGGIGSSRATCGTLMGAVIALGAVLGRTELDTPRKLVAYDRARWLYEHFVSETGSDVCAVLCPDGFDVPDHRMHCARFVMLAARLGTAVLLADNAEVDREAYARGEQPPPLDARITK